MTSSSSPSISLSLSSSSLYLLCLFSFQKSEDLEEISTENQNQDITRPDTNTQIKVGQDNLVKGKLSQGKAKESETTQLALLVVPQKHQNNNNNMYGVDLG